MTRVFKSVQRVSGVSKAYRQWTEWQAGDIVIGKYIDSHVDKFTQKLCPVIEVLDVFFKKESEGVRILGKELVLNNTGMIEKAFKKIEIGQLVQIQYDGKSVMTSGPYIGKESHITKVEIVVEETDSSDAQTEMEMGEVDDL